MYTEAVRLNRRTKSATDEDIKSEVQWYCTALQIVAAARQHEQSRQSSERQMKPMTECYIL